MSNSNCIPAKPTFGKLNPQLFPSDYIKNKANYTIIKNKKTKFGIKNNNFNRTSSCINDKCAIGCCSIDYTKLNSNLITKENLKGVNVIETFPNGITPTTINPNLTTPFYFNYVIDPSGELFGNTCCGIDNYLSYRQLKFV